MAGKADLGKTFLEELKGKLPDALHAHVDSILSSPEAQAALDVVGSRVSPLDEERQRLHELQTTLSTKETRLNDWHQRLDGWRVKQETDYAAREEQLRAKEAGGGNTPPGDLPPKTTPTGDSMTKAEIEKMVGDYLAPREAGYVQYVADAARFSTFHLQHFKEPLDVTALVRHPQIGELGFQRVYELVHKDKIDAMNAAKVAADRDALKEELRKELLTERPVDMPYPVGDGSPLDALNLDPAKRPTGDPAAAARMYDSLVSAGR